MPASDLQDTIALLRRTPAVLDALLRDLPDTWTLTNEGGASWNALDIVGHLIHGERADWMPRVKVILESGDGRLFEAFDRAGHEQEMQDKSLAKALDSFARARTASLDELIALDLQPVDLERRGRHPAFGVVTLSQLLSTWAAHDLTHLHQLSRVMAHQTRDSVGPWSAYLGVLHCTAHGA